MDLSLLKIQRKSKRVLSITIAWQFVAVLNAFFTYVYVDAVAPGVAGIDLYQCLIYSILAATLGGLLISGLEIFYLRNMMRSRSFAMVLLAKGSLYLLLLWLVLLFSVMLYFQHNLGQNMFSSEVLHATRDFLIMTPAILEYVFWGVVMIVTFMYLDISERFGPGGFSGYIFGRYHKPKTEMRIFMFLDIKGSTHIAEKLDNVQYFDLLDKFFRDITNSIVITKGEIYQYVGDEVLVSWTLKNGLRHAHCINCFFDIKRVMRKKKEEYLETYGVFPEFKAGFHFGEVMAGEMGVVKRDVVYSGDVLNTASRIQELCNNYNVDLLISKRLLNEITLPEILESRPIDTIVLRGKKTKIDLYTIIHK